MRARLASGILLVFRGDKRLEGAMVKNGLFEGFFKNFNGMSKKIIMRNVNYRIWKVSVVEILASNK